MPNACSELFALDSNFLVYALEGGSDERCRTANKLLKEYVRDGRPLFVPLQVLAETYAVLCSKAASAEQKARCLDAIEGLAALDCVTKAGYCEKTLLSAMRLSARHGRHFWDCMIAATMMENGVRRIYTENVLDFEGIGGIEAVNPFKPNKR